jgi:hypothetical protein
VINISNSSEANSVANLVNSCPTDQLLPSLRTLVLDVQPTDQLSLDYELKFFSKNLEDLFLITNDSDTKRIPEGEVLQFVRGIATHSPNITCLGLSIDDAIPSKAMEGGMVLLMNSLDRIKELHGASLRFTPQFLIAASRLPNLRHLIIDCDCDWQAGVKLSKTLATAEANHDCAFLSLVELEINQPNDIKGAFFRSHRLFARLQKLTVSMLSSKGDRDFQALFSAFADNCCSLVELDVSQPPVMVRDAASAHVSFNFNYSSSIFGKTTLLPLRSLKNLTSLTFDYALSNDMSDTDFLEFVSVCPQLTELCVHPTWDSRCKAVPVTNLSIKAIHLLSYHENSLRSLQLCIRVEVPDVTLEGLSCGDQLQNLMEIGFSNSPVDIDDSDHEGLHRAGRFIQRCISTKCQRIRESGITGWDGRTGLKEDNEEDAACLRNMQRWDRIWEVMGH